MGRSSGNSPVLHRAGHVVGQRNVNDLMLTTSKQVTQTLIRVVGQILPHAGVVEYVNTKLFVKTLHTVETGNFGDCMSERHRKLGSENVVGEDRDHY
jgi:hypothetical protein